MKQEVGAVERRSFLVAGASGAAGLGMIAAGWALARWPASVLDSLDRVLHAMGGSPDSLGAAARSGHDATAGGGTQR